MRAARSNNFSLLCLNFIVSFSSKCLLIPKSVQKNLFDHLYVLFYLFVAKLSHDPIYAWRKDLWGRAGLLVLSFWSVSHFYILGDSEVNAILYCNFAYPYYWEGCVICSIYLRKTSGSPRSTTNNLSQPRRGVARPKRRWLDWTWRNTRYALSLANLVRSDIIL